jgi:hypothetical protein
MSTGLKASMIAALGAVLTTVGGCAEQNPGPPGTYSPSPYGAYPTYPGYPSSYGRPVYYDPYYPYPPRRAAPPPPPPPPPPSCPAGQVLQGGKCFKTNQ